MIQFCSVTQLYLFVTPWTTAFQAFLSSPTPRACSDSCPSSQLCHPIISSSTNHITFFSINSIFLSLNMSVSTKFKIKVVFQRNLGCLFSYQHLCYLTIITSQMCLSPLSFSSTYNPQYRREKVEAVTDFIFLGSKSLEAVTVVMKLQDACSLEGQPYIQTYLDRVLKSRDNNG